MRRMAVVNPQATERDFYLRSFRHRSMVLHVAEPYGEEDVRSVVDELVDNGTLVVVVARQFLAGRGVRVRPREVKVPGTGLFAVSATLMQTGLAHVRQLPGREPTRLRFSCRLATKLAAHKLVVIDSRGGIASTLGVRSFVNADALARLARKRGGVSGWSRPELRELRATVLNGVDSINLTTAETLDAELFSYEGAGTLLTATDYCRVEPLRLDDFPQALTLLERGEREGFLLPRTPDQRARVLLSAYGAWFEGHRLAGLAALETDAYRRERLAEVVGLYTITRFKGEGVGVRIVEALTEVARERGCHALFACTSNPRAASFFLRDGFMEVEPSWVPARKWEGRRRPLPEVFWRDL
jgi:N-acetylglutamate synthase-like GNAT family acetyltransferase